MAPTLLFQSTQLDGCRSELYGIAWRMLQIASANEGEANKQYLVPV